MNGGWCPLPTTSMLVTDTYFALPISKTLDEIKCWETMADLRNPFTLEMLALLNTRAKLAPQDSHVEAMADWCEIGLFTGQRRP